MPDEIDVALRRLALLGYAKARVERPGSIPKHMPRVSVVIPCYNYGHFLPACVESVLSQPGIDIDILIVDDASTDGSSEVVRAAAVKDARVRAVYHEQNKGHIATYNEGLSQVDGDYVALLSADDLLAPGSLLRATTLMERNPGVGLTYGLAVDFLLAPPSLARRTATSWTIWRGHDWLEDRCRTGRNALRSPEAIMRKSVLQAVGGYDAALPHAADFDLWMRAASIADVGYVGGTTQAYYRLHSSNMHNVDFERAAASGTITDLRQRHACFASVLQDGANIADGRALFATACRSLAREALVLAIRSYEWGEAGSWPVAELASFAEQICPREQLRSLWTALARRRKLGTTRSSQSPLFVLNKQMYKLRCGVDEWRWRQAGI
jgi:GT2 family glycosyltransferase